jgi:hypothetical protein
MLRHDFRNALPGPFHDFRIGRYHRSAEARSHDFADGALPGSTIPDEHDIH